MHPNYLIRIVIIGGILVFCACNCDGYRTKVKRRVESVPQSSTVTSVVQKNNTEKRNERGFLPTGGLFALGKVLNFLPVGGERECAVTKGFTPARSGICLNPYDCRQRDGKAAGDCAHGLGVCCVFEVTCGGTVQNNLTYFVSPGFPQLWAGGENCSITIDKAHAGIMQLRLDFEQFNIGQPNRTTGECDRDVMTLGGGDNKFQLCGQNHGQHMYYTLPTTVAESRESDELAGEGQTRLSVRPSGRLDSRVWLVRLAQLPLANSAPNDCLQYYTGDSGIISTFNYASNGRHLADQQYRACVRRNPGMCAVRYQPCDERSFRIGQGERDGDGDPVLEDDLMPADSEVMDDVIEGSGEEPGAAAVAAPAQPSVISRIWSFMFPSWLWGQQRSWRWSPYAQHYSTREEDGFLYQGYGNFGDGLRGYGRLQCQDRITIPCDNEYLISNTLNTPGVCDPHHCGTSFCPGLPFVDCHVQTSLAPFAVSIHFGDPTPKASVEDNIGACLAYTQMPCDS